MGAGIVAGVILVTVWDDFKKIIVTSLIGIAVSIRPVIMNVKGNPETE